LVLNVALAGCRCGPDVPTPVTLRLKNTSRGDLFVDDSDARLGLRVQRRVGGEWLSFVEAPRCACQACELVCDGCACDAGSTEPLVRKLAAGQSLERTWPGTVQVSGTGSCSGSFVAGPACLTAENPPVDETFRLELCYAPEASGAAEGDGGSVSGTLPAASVACVTREFKPLDGVVEVSPLRGADCTAHADCKGKGELCFGGACTTACPSTGFPEVGAAWQVRVQEPNDQGFFTVAQTDAGRLYTGTGKVGSVQYQNGTMTVWLERPAVPAGTWRGAVFLTLPPGSSVPLSAGPTVVARLLDHSSATSYDDRALTFRELDGGLILAADSAQGRALLGAADTAPFSVAPGPDVVACQHDDCGKRLYYQTRFTGGPTEVLLEPGKTALSPVAGATYQLLNVADYRYESTFCPLKALSPYAILRQGP
jgi:hypothetical protein